jgi:serine/threonine protein kinase
VQVLAQLDHPNVVKYHDCFSDEQYINIVMEYCDAGDLGDVIKASGRPPLLGGDPSAARMLAAFSVVQENEHPQRRQCSTQQPMPLLVACTGCLPAAGGG